MSVVRSLSALCVYIEGREKKQAVALQRWLLKNHSHFHTFHTSCFAGVQDSHP